MGWPEVAGNHTNPVTKRCCRRRVHRQIPARPAAVGREILLSASSGGGAPHGPARVACGWPEVPPLVLSSTASRWLLGLNGVPGLESFLLGFWGLKSCFWARVFTWHHKLCLYRV